MSYYTIYTINYTEMNKEFYISNSKKQNSAYMHVKSCCIINRTYLLYNMILDAYILKLYISFYLINIVMLCANILFTTTLGVCIRYPLKQGFST